MKQIHDSSRMSSGTGALGVIARHAASLLLISLVLTGLFAIFQDVAWRNIPRVFLLMAIMTMSFGVVMGSLYGLVWPRIARRMTGFPAQAALHVVLIGGGSVLATESALLLLRLAGWEVAPGMRTSVLGVGIIVSCVAVGMTITMERLSQRAREAELRAKLEALQARTHPHFLFNSLNTAAGLIAEDPVKAEQVIERLSNLYRHVLQRSDAAWIRLDEEVQAVRDYLEVESLRLGERLRHEIRCDEAVMSTMVPPMILQPLVENAVLHGIASRREGGSVLVIAEQVAGTLRLVVEDDGPGPGSSGHRGTGSSFEDLRARLRLACGEGASVTMERATPEGGCRVVVDIPQRAQGVA